MSRPISLRDYSRTFNGAYRFGESIAQLARVLVALGRGEIRPHVGFRGVLRHALTVAVHEPEVELRGGVTLVGGEAVPAGGFRVVLRYATTVAVHAPEVVLGAGVALVGGEAVPADGFRVVLRHALTVAVHEPEVVLGAGVALLSGKAPPRHGLGHVLRYALGGVVHEAEAGLRSGVALGSEAAQSGHVRRVLAADECYYGQQPDAARRCDQPTMSLPHETALHFLILIVRARLVNGAAALRNLTGASGSVAYAGGPSAGGPMARTADDTTLARADPGPGRSAAGVQRSSDPIRNGGRKD